MQGLIASSILAASIAAAGGDTTWVELRWPEAGCPSGTLVGDSLEALGLQPLEPGGIVPAEVGVAIVDAARRDEILDLVITEQGHIIRRSVALSGTCEERAAVVAAIIERAVSPGADLISYDPALLLSERGSTQNTDLEREPPLALQNNDDLSPDWDPGGVGGVTGGAANSHRFDHLQALHHPRWIFAGAAVVAGGEGPTVRGGADAEVRYEFAEEIFAVVRLSYRNPQVEQVGTATVRIDDGIGAIGLQIGSPAEPFALQTAALIQIAWAHGIGFAEEHSIVEANPGFTVGACYQNGLGDGAFGIEVCARGFGFLRRQEVHVNDTPVVGLPRVGGEIALGVVYQVEQLVD